MKSQEETISFKKQIALAVATAFVVMFFSFMSGPFLRALAKTKSQLFWLVGFCLVTGLFIFKLNLLSIYVGAVWMTLGAYNEMEKRGINWKISTAASVAAGVISAAASFMTMLNPRLNLAVSGQSLTDEITKPIIESLNQILPSQAYNSEMIAWFLPGILASALFSSLMMGFIFERQIFSLFELKKEKFVTAIKWIELRMPDAFIWLALFGLVLILVNASTSYSAALKIIGINITIVSIVVFFFQGLSVAEFAARVYRLGPFAKMLFYVMIFFWAAPAISLIGLVDYWVDFRKLIRKKIKAI